MDAIRITDLPLESQYQLRDKINLQRQEAGVWNDYHTEIGTYLGQYKTWVYDWDLSAGLGETITCPAGKYLVVLGAHYTYSPGAIFTSNTVQLLLNSTSGNWSYIGEFPHVGSGRGGLLFPALGSGPSWNIYGDLDEDLILSSGGTGSGSPDQGTCRIQIQYVEVTPI